MRKIGSTSCFVIAWLFILSSGLILCACPLWPAMGLAIAVMGTYLKSKETNPASMLPILTLIAALAVTVMHGAGKYQEYRRSVRVKAKIQAQSLAKEPATNSPVEPTTHNPQPALQ